MNTEKDTDTGIGTNTGKWYRYRGSVWIQENDTVLKNSISKDFKLFTTINKKINQIIEQTSGLASKRPSKQS